MESEQIKKIEKKYVMQTYNRYPIVLDHGKGNYVYDKNGKKYLDFITGIACVPIGHANKEINKMILHQAKKLIQVSNLYYTEPQVVLAKKLASISGLQKSFFCNSGSEANETAIKLAKKITKKKKFIAFKHSFHGRTTASLAATDKPLCKQPFTPLAPEVVFVEYNNISALEKTMKKDIAAVILEPIQGEGGINIPEKNYLKKVEQLCRKNNILLIVDEVQTGNGRTGKFFAYQHENIKPDIVTVAKGLANGVPIGVCIAKKGIDFDKGDHGCTFGGNNLACASANATIDYILKNKIMENAENIGNYFVEKLNKLKDKYEIIKDIKGKGLMIGVELKENKAKEIVKKCLENGLLMNNVSDTTLRFLPPLIIGKREAHKALKILKKVLKTC